MLSCRWQQLWTVQRAGSIAMSELPNWWKHFSTDWTMMEQQWRPGWSLHQVRVASAAASGFKKNFLQFLFHRVLQVVDIWLLLFWDGCGSGGGWWQLPAPFIPPLSLFSAKLSVSLCTLTVNAINMVSTTSFPWRILAFKKGLFWGAEPLGSLFRTFSGREIYKCRKITRCYW